jgi:hypothetical protein
MASPIIDPPSPVPSQRAERGMPVAPSDRCADFRSKMKAGWFPKRTARVREGALREVMLRVSELLPCRSYKGAVWPAGLV